ncbi:hypothetical protein CYMTET_34252, partial [Cymbomonas tetramitiformis]
MISPTIFTGNSFAEVPEETITSKIYLEIGVCPEDFNPGRTLGELAVCNDTEPLGKVVLGLYGDVVPETVRIFTDLITGKNGTGGYKGTVFNKVIPGQYVTAGRQGPRRLGQMENVQAPTNSDVLSSKAFRLTAARPGAVSLFVQNEGVNRQRGRTEFAIATGFLYPAPCLGLVYPCAALRASGALRTRPGPRGILRRASGLFPVPCSWSVVLPVPRRPRVPCARASGFVYPCAVFRVLCIPALRFGLLVPLRRASGLVYPCATPQASCTPAPCLGPRVPLRRASASCTPVPLLGPRVPCAAPR